MKTVPQTFSAVIADAEKIHLRICKRQAFVWHKNRPLEFLSVTRQEAGTAKRASEVLQFNQQLGGDAEEVRAGFLGAECPLGAAHGARCSSTLQGCQPWHSGPRGLGEVPSLR